MGSKRRKVLEDWPPVFWDNLSELFITPRCLREFDRRTTSAPQTFRPTCYEVKDEYILPSKRFARLGGPDLDDLHFYTDSAIKTTTLTADSSERFNSEIFGSPTDDDSSVVMKSITAYDPSFEQHLNDNGITTGEGETNAILSKIITRMRRRRQSLSESNFSDATWQQYKKTALVCKTQAEVVERILPGLLRNSDTIIHASNRLFDHFESMASTPGVTLSTPMPDWYDGRAPSQEDIRLRDVLGKSIMPCTDVSLPMLPNFFIEFKGSADNGDACRLQAIHDGLFGARSMNRIMSYAFEHNMKGHDITGYAIIATLAGSTLSMAIVHTAQATAPHRELDYHVTPLFATVLTSDKRHFREAAQAFRNLREWAKEQREAAISAANKRIAKYGE